MIENYHTPALLNETLLALDIKPNGIYVDVTFGGGGHSRAILNRLSNEGHLYAVDQDKDALNNIIDDPRMTLIHGNFRFLKNYLKFYNVEKVDGILADLGVSSHHFDTPQRGFSFRAEGPLDMRMNIDSNLTAAEFLKKTSSEELARVFRVYGELPSASKIASAIVKQRELLPIDTTTRLLEVVTPYINPRQEKKELAQLFQALRIHVNKELSVLEQFLIQSKDLLKNQGRIAIISYHSLEDRIIKNFFRTGTFDDDKQPDIFGRPKSPFHLLNSKPIIPSRQEVEENPRSRSAKLRVAVKI
ncbi:MAG: 16S rRNA (cytosine(1402)-N(4))-methyltransferase RsmH [Muribaculaceae bacterium]|nr:16S rRNA (cytosine(1402)-N(4))-methyltransferase RsmH [Muribaculaceae bacterium]